MRKRIVSLLLVALLASMAFASGPYSEIIPLSSSVYDDMDDLYAICGIGTPSSARPWSKGEAQLILSRVDEQSLYGVGKTLYDSLASRIDTGLKWQFSDGFGMGLGLDVALEFYTHSNTKDFIKDTAWVYGFEDRKPLLKAWMDFSVMDFFYTYADLQYGMGRFNPNDLYVDLSRLNDPSYVDSIRNQEGYQDWMGNWVGVGAIVPSDLSGIGTAWYVTQSLMYSKQYGWNIPPQTADFEFEWPKRAFISFGGEHWNLSFGRDRLEWGTSTIGNLVLDNHVDFHEYFRLSAFTDHFKYEWLNLFFDTFPGNSESQPTSLRMFMMHRLEFRPWNWLTFSISENVMFQTDNILDPRFLNPAFIFHNLNNRSMFNALAFAELDVMVYRGLGLYGQFALDQAQAPNESDAQGSGWGALGGVKYSQGLGPGILTTSLEYSYTTPLLYRRDGVDFLMFRKYFTLDNSTETHGYVLHFDFIGSPYGGDAQVLKWAIRYRMPGYGEVNLSVMGMQQGELGMFMSHSESNNNNDYPDYKGKTPSGNIITETIVASLGGKYSLPQYVSWLDISFWTQLDWIGTRKHIRSSNTYGSYANDIQFTVGMQVSI